MGTEATARARGAALGLLVLLNAGLPLDASAALDCSLPQGNVDFATANVLELSGSTTGGPTLADAWPCAAGDFTGAEAVWELVLPNPGLVAVQVLSSQPGQAAFLVSACDESACLAAAVPGSSDCVGGLAAGTYWVVVDGAAGLDGDFELRLVWEPDFPRWDDCQLPVPPTQPSDTIAEEWHFDDLATCIDDPQSLNFPDGCGFAMYLTVPCGSTLDVFPFDVEGGHVRIYDVFEGRYVTFEAVAAGFELIGDDLAWEDRGCPGPRPDPLEDYVELRLQDPGGLCGLFRLEFAPDHAGSAWSLSAACDFGAMPGTPIGDSPCAVLDLYDPHPQLQLGSIVETPACPELSISYELVNVGCAAAEDVVVRVRDEFAVVGEERVARIEPGETLTRVLDLGPVGRSESLLLFVDPDDAIVECDEPAFPRPGGCTPPISIDIVSLAGCPPTCSINARALARPEAVCLDSPPAFLEIDASGSLSVDCPFALSYALFDGLTWTPPQASPLFTIPPPSELTNYFVQVTCGDPYECSAWTSVQVAAYEEPEPPAVFRARDLSACDGGIELEWSEAVFHGWTGTGAYNLLRSPTGCDADLEIVRTGLTLADSPFVDVPPAGGGPWHYVLEAEDDTNGSACTPGVAHGGSAVRIAADDGTCAPILDQESCPEGDCADGLDGDGDGLVDCDDDDCLGAAPCGERDCRNGLDDDGDGLVDCVDPDCDGRTECEDCTNRRDDDGDGDVDCLDADCRCDTVSCPLRDCDGDGEPNLTDCEPTDASVRRVPEPAVLELSWSPATGRLQVLWQDLAALGGPSTLADIARGDLADLQVAGGAAAACVTEGLDGDRFVDAASPPSAYYLVRGVNACGPPRGEGWGSDSLGDPRPTCP